MSDQDIFEEKPADQQTEVETKQEEVAPPEVVDPFAEKLMAITSEDGKPKYASTEKALDALKASQAHIQRLEQEARERELEKEELARKAATAESLEEVVRKLKNSETEKPVEKTTPDGGLDEEKLLQLIEKVNERKAVEASAINNVKQVSDKLLAKYGDKVQDVIKAKAEELGMTNEDLKQLSARSPAAVLAFFGDKPSSPAPTKTSTNTDGFGKTQPEELKRPEKSLLSGSGANDKNRREYIRQIKEKVYKDHGVE